MGLEDDLFNAMKYTSFSGGASPMRLMQTLVRNMELQMLKQLRLMVDLNIARLQRQQSGVGSTMAEADAGTGGFDSAMDPFSILGVSMNATEEEVKAAYKKKAHDCHPDLGGSDAEMAKVNAAFQVIKMFKGWS